MSDELPCLNQVLMNRIIKIQCLDDLILFVDVVYLFLLAADVE